MDQLWTLVWVNGSGKREDIVPPMDCNPASCDEGMLVYRSFEAAGLAAEHQTTMYASDGYVASPIRLDEAMGLVEAAHAE